MLIPIKGKLREYMSREFVKPVKSVPRLEGFIITVGDRTTEEFLKRGIKPRIAVVDWYVERRPLGVESIKTISLAYVNDRWLFIYNPRGYFNTTALKIAKEVCERGGLVWVYGEEDSIALAFMKACSPDYIAFGLRGKGIEILDKEKIREVLRDCPIPSLFRGEMHYNPY